MKILIIGGNGYVGTHLIDYITNNHPEYQIVMVDYKIYDNLNQLPNIQYICAKFQDLPVSFYEDFTDIIMLSGQSSVGNSNDLLTVVENNVRSFAWLINLIRPEQKLIYASSSSIYCNTYGLDVDEEYNKTSNNGPYNYYDWSKYSIDQLAELSGKQYYSLRFATVNGFSRNFRNDIMINSMIFNAIQNSKVYVSNGQVNRPILGIDDLSRAIMTIIQKGQKKYSGIYNLNSFNTTVNEIAEFTSNICNVPCENINTNINNSTINFNVGKKIYDFRIHSQKFINTFNFQFKETMSSIVSSILENWKKIEHCGNRNTDNYTEYKHINKCRVCNSKTNSLLDLGYQPLANKYNKYSITDVNPLHINAEEKYPLHLHLCPVCYHIQLNCIVNPEKLFRNYLYVSGTSNTLRGYFNEFAKMSLSKHINHIKQNDGMIANKTKNIKVLEIACNDGSLLDEFQKETPDGFQVTTIGVDPAENIYNNISSHKTNHTIYCEFLKKSTVDKLKEKYGYFDIIVAQNVVAHIDYPCEFIGYLKELMTEHTTLYLQTSQKNMILLNQFDTVYHEHLSFFNTNSMNILCKRNGLIIRNVNEHPIHGISYIFEIVNVSSTDASFVGTDIKPQECNNVIEGNTNEVILQETRNGLYSDELYKKYHLKCIQYKNLLTNKVLEYKLQGKQIIAFGSTAKSMTVLNFCELTSKYIDFMIDESPYKEGLYTPGSNILVYPISGLNKIEKSCVIMVTAWNFYEEIKEKIKKYVKIYTIETPILLLNIDNLMEEFL